MDHDEFFDDTCENQKDEGLENVKNDVLSASSSCARFKKRGKKVRHLK